MKVSNVLNSVVFVSAIAFSSQAFALSNTTPLGNLNDGPVTDADLLQVGVAYLPKFFTFSLDELSNVTVDFDSLANLSLGSTFSLLDSSNTTLKTFAMPTVTILGGPELSFNGLNAGSYKFAYTPGLATLGFATTVTFTAVPVPEPETNALMLVGLGMMGFIARRKFS